MRVRLTRAVAVLALLALLGVSPGCEDDPEDPIDSAPTTRTFQFGMRGIPGEEGQFVATTMRTDVIAALEAELRLTAAERTLHIHGPIDRGHGGHNLSWSWHFIPDAWQMVEISVEVCDGTPEGVEADIDYWVDNVGQFCPWGSYVQREL
jgi:hypothetical protein